MRVLVAAFIVLVIPTLASAQKPKRQCSGTMADSAEQALGPIYRDCEVDQPAERQGSQPSLNFTPPNPIYGASVTSCVQAVLQFVVDTLGKPEVATIHTISSNNSEFEHAVIASVGELRYRPARREGMTVRQIVVYGQTVTFQVEVVAPVGHGRTNETPMTPQTTRC